MSDIDNPTNDQPAETNFTEPATPVTSPIPGGQTIGQMLKTARLKQNLTLDKVAESTKVRRKFLEALEIDDFKSLPNLVAARGFTKVYAEYLGLNVLDFINYFNYLFPDQAVGANSPRQSEKEIKFGLEVSKDSLFPAAMKSMNSQGMFSRTAKMWQSKKLLGKNNRLIIGIAAALILSSLYFKVSMDSIKTVPRTQSDLQQLEAKMTPEAMNNMNIDQKKVYVNAQAIGKTYTTVIMDGRLLFRGNLEEGESKSWEGDQYIKIKTSVPRNLRLFVNGKDEGVLADQITILERTFFPGSSTSNNITANTTVPAEATKTKETVLEEKKPAEITGEETKIKAEEKTEAKPAQPKTQENTNPYGL